MSYKEASASFAHLMRRRINRTLNTRLHRRIAIGVVVVIVFATTSAIADFYLPNLFPFLNSTGVSATYSNTGRINLSGAFFQSLGTNGRSCGTCHQPSDGFGLTPGNAQLRYLLTHGKDPLFAQVDAGTCPTGPLDNSLVLRSGLIRVGLTLPTANLQYTITAVEDPYGCAITTDSQQQQTISIYRRPLPSTNLRFLSTVMFDGRESMNFPLNNPQTYAANLNMDLTQQAIDATLGHAQGTQPPTAAQLQDIVSFEMSLNSAQLADLRAGDLSRGANGGPKFLSTQEYYPGINDSLGGDPHGDAFNATAFTMFSSYQNSQNGQQASIARGEQIFNTQPLNISNVPGLVTGSGSIMGTCTTCHDSFNVGNHSLPLPLDIGTSHSSEYETDANISAALQQLQSPPKLPVFQLVCTQGPLAGNTYYSSDPGKALITGQCADIGRGKGPVLRSLASRAPYFHNGVAANLQQLVNFYDQRFQIGLTDQQQRDLVNFLQSL
jgi:cytochrome c peroxidase